MRMLSAPMTGRLWTAIMSTLRFRSHTRAYPPVEPHRAKLETFSEYASLDAAAHDLTCMPSLLVEFFLGLKNVYGFRVRKSDKIEGTWIATEIIISCLGGDNRCRGDGPRSSAADT